jgi:hypothetical protein
MMVKRPAPLFTPHLNRLFAKNCEMLHRIFAFIFGVFLLSCGGGRVTISSISYIDLINQISSSLTSSIVGVIL